MFYKEKKFHRTLLSISYVKLKDLGSQEPSWWYLQKIRLKYDALNLWFIKVLKQFSSTHTRNNHRMVDIHGRSIKSPPTYVLASV